MTLEEKIKSLPDGRTLFQAGRRGDFVTTDLTTDDIKRMVEALKHYADESNWYQQTSEIDGSSLDDFDAFHCEGNGYDIAQNALK